MLQNCILSHIDNTLLKTMPDINQALLQFIDIMHVASPNLSINDAGDKWRKRLCVCIFV